MNPALARGVTRFVISASGVARVTGRGDRSAWDSSGVQWWGVVLSGLVVGGYAEGDVVEENLCEWIWRCWLTTLLCRAMRN